MPALDTTVLVRLLVEDDPGQLEIARAYVERNGTEGALFVSSTVVLELEWVLRSRYGFEKRAIVDTFGKLLEAHEVAFEDEPTMERALSLYDDGAADFADCLHLAVATTRDRVPLVTFDRKAATLPGAERLG